MPDDMPPEIACPGCGAINWRHDGLAIVADGARIDVRPETCDDDPGWCCGACGHTLDPELPLARALTRLREHDAAYGVTSADG